jgi:hypothetical protein
MLFLLLSFFFFLKLLHKTPLLACLCAPGLFLLGAFAKGLWNF